MQSCIDAVNACPKCRDPVTFGGGIGITYFSAFESVEGLKNPCFSHHEYQPASTAVGSYALAIGCDKSHFKHSLFNWLPFFSPGFNFTTWVVDFGCSASVLATGFFGSFLVSFCNHIGITQRSTTYRLSFR